MNLRNLRWLLWPLLVLLGIGIWWSLSKSPNQSAGYRVYMQHCANCHMEKGQGLARLIPPLANADYFQQLSMEDLVCIIRNGQKDSIKVNEVYFDRPMPANEVISPVEMTSLINYMAGEWMNPEAGTSFEALKAALGECP